MSWACRRGGSGQYGEGVCLPRQPPRRRGDSQYAAAGPSCIRPASSFPAILSAQNRADVGMAGRMDWGHRVADGDGYYALGQGPSPAPRLADEPVEEGEYARYRLVWLKGHGE